MRNRAYRRYMNYVKTQHKKKHCQFDAPENLTKVQLGKLRKGKNYCSCYCCNGADKWNGIFCMRRERSDMILKQDIRDYLQGDY